MRHLAAVLLLVALPGCGASESPMRPEDWIAVGVEPTEEARRVLTALDRAGWRLARRVDAEPFIALAFTRGPVERAVRVITRRGVVVALDSHEPDGVRVRHGRVALYDGAPPDVDADGVPELVVVRTDTPTPCVAVLQVDASGRVRALSDQAGALREGACMARLEDVDGDGTLEGIVPLRWPALSLSRLSEAVPEVEAVLALHEDTFEAAPLPVDYVARQRARRSDALVEARARQELARTVTLAVELAALGHLTGASLAAQVSHFDEALSGLVLTGETRDRVRQIRSVIASGWREPGR